MAKLEAYAARLMLVIHLVRKVSGDTLSDQIDATTVRMAERLVSYFKAHAIRVYSQVLGAGQVTSVPPGDRVSDWLLRKGDPGVCPRDLISAGLAPDAETAKSTLDELLRQGRGTWHKGVGEKVDRFYLSTKHQAPSS